jgi:hypothetical protein
MVKLHEEVWSVERELYTQWGTKHVVITWRNRHTPQVLAQLKEAFLDRLAHLKTVGIPHISLSNVIHRFSAGSMWSSKYDSSFPAGSM